MEKEKEMCEKFQKLQISLPLNFKLYTLEDEDYCSTSLSMNFLPPKHKKLRVKEHINIIPDFQNSKKNK